MHTPNNSISWFWVVLVLLVFWPAGLFLLFKKLEQDRSATMKSGSLLALLSFFLMFLGFIFFTLILTDGAGYIFPMLLFGGGGFWLFRISRRMKATGKRYRSYIELIINQGHTSIEYIAQIMGVTYRMAEADLQKMIERGFFQGAYIDRTKRMIVLQPVAQQAQSGQVMPQERVVACKGCGANNRVLTHVSECEYCGSPIA